MLVDPYGNKLQSSQSIEIVGGSIQDGTGELEYLVEACDPCEADKYAYPIQGIAVSDFITPRFYDPVVTPGTRYSFKRYANTELMEHCKKHRQSLARFASARGKFYPVN